MPPARRSVHVRLFASAGTAAGRSSLELDVPAGGIGAAELVRGLATAHPQLRSILRASRFVRNGRYLTDLRQRVRPGDEFSVHPPYGGG